MRKISDQKSLGGVDETSEIDAMAEACLRAHAVITEHGTPEMLALIRVLLFQIGQEIARRKAEPGEKRDGE